LRDGRLHALDRQPVAYAVQKDQPFATSGREPPLQARLCSFGRPTRTGVGHRLRDGWQRRVHHLEAIQLLVLDVVEVGPASHR